MPLEPNYNPFKYMSSSADACIRLRGLPLKTRSLDVHALLTKNGIVNGLTDEKRFITTLRTRRGGPSGQAIVKFRTIVDACKAQSILNNQLVEDRYIEVYAYASPFMVVCSTPEPEYE